MDDALSQLWPHFDEANPLFSESTIGTWPHGVFDRLRSSGILHQAEPATYVACPSCCDGHEEEVVLVNEPDGTTSVYIPCPVNLRVPIADDLRRQWTINWGRFVQLLAIAVGASGTHKPVIPGLLWRLGKVAWQSGKREALFACGIRLPGLAHVAESVSRFNQPVLFVGDDLSPTDAWGWRQPAIVALSQIATLGTAGIELDRIALASVLAEADVAARAAEAEALDHRKLKELVRQQVKSERNARLTNDALVVAYKQCNSYRKAADAMCAQGFKTDRWAVERAVKAAGGPEAVRMQSDSNSVRRTVASRSCDRKKKFASPTQPPDEQ